MFSVPILAAFAFVAWMNYARYGRPTPLYFDHELLTVAWRARMTKWGMLNYHYVGKNLGIALTSLPWLSPRAASRPCSARRSRLTRTASRLCSPLRPCTSGCWWPRRFDGEPGRRWLYVVVALSAVLPVVMDLMYQNSGCSSATGSRTTTPCCCSCCWPWARGRCGASLRPWPVWSVAVNLFGAATFDKGEFDSVSILADGLH